MTSDPSPFARLPAVERVLASAAGISLLESYAAAAVTEAVRGAVDDLRRLLGRGESVPDDRFSPDAMATAARGALARTAAPRLRRVVNATGVVLHTNLGRATVAAEAIEAVVAAATGACTLEYDVATGQRGDRDALVEEHLKELTGAEAVTVVNNNAAALILVLNSLADAREAVVSRGELIEIGGSFRIPDIMAKSGARMVEVGTTNRTHARDYAGAIGPDTAMVLKVHTSNYRVVGFTAEVGLAELAGIASEHSNVSVVEDLGSGALVDLTAWGLPSEPVVRDRLAAGADIVTFSGDKLLGGPQCGIIAGRRDLVAAIRKNPLKRALRCDKMTLAALEATLSLYRFSPDLAGRLPVLRALSCPLDELRARAADAAGLLRAALGEGYTVEIVDSLSQAGSGSQPGVTIPSVALSVASPSHSADALARRFREASPPVIGRIERDRFLLDMRALESASDVVPG